MINNQLSEKLLNYKNSVASKYIPVRSDQILSRVFDLDKYYVSTKMDGHLCFIIKEKNDISILNHNSNPFDRQELISEIEKILKDDDGVFVGEIYFHKENERTRSYNLKREISEKSSDIRIALFDVLNHKGKEFVENDWNTKKD